MIYLSVLIRDDYSGNARVEHVCGYDTVSERDAALNAFNTYTRRGDWLAVFPCDFGDFVHSDPGLFEKAQAEGIQYCLENPIVAVAGVNYQADLRAELVRLETRIARGPGNPYGRSDAKLDTPTWTRPKGSYEDAFRLKDPDWDLPEDTVVRRDTRHDYPFETDYPFEQLGDTPHELAPMRRCKVLSYDGNKYCDIIVVAEWGDTTVEYVEMPPESVLPPDMVRDTERVLRTNIKRGYIYRDASIDDIHPGRGPQPDSWRECIQDAVERIASYLGADDISPPKSPAEVSLMTDMMIDALDGFHVQMGKRRVLDALYPIRAALGMDPLETGSSSEIVQRILDGIPDRPTLSLEILEPIAQKLYVDTVRSGQTSSVEGIRARIDERIEELLDLERHVMNMESAP